MPASGKPADSLIVLLHGYGADGNDLIDLGRYWAPLLPDTAFISPHAPDPCDEAPYGRQWFPLAGIDAHKLWAGVTHVAPALNAFIDAELTRLGLPDDRLALVGFSQGTMMALHIGPRRAHKIAGIVGYSGLLPGPERLTVEMKNAPPILLLHGDADPIVPVMALHAAAQVLTVSGFDVVAHVRPGLQHGIDEHGLKLGGEFLERVLGN